MLRAVSSNIMRTTVDLDATVLQELKQRAAREGKSLGRLISEIAAAALSNQTRTEQEPFVWHAQAMGARIDLADKEALWSALKE